uniref:Endonuclease III-like protein 1 n=1 Tax=Crypthecodinium cohnii TaxID=2866 RepID=A0A516AGV5_CRYCO|nr:endonuclease III-like protein 1 [Crypthecodinium cohnii]
MAPQNRDNITFEATADIIKKAPTAEEVLALAPESLEASCKKTRFAARKAKAIREATKILVEKYGGDLPQTMKELTGLPGIGTKSAAFLMMVCWGKVEAAKVDVHVHRICNRLGWVSTTTEEKTRLELESWLPRSHWGVDGLKQFVGFGQEICTAQKPKCSDCAVKERCPSAKLP